MTDVLGRRDEKRGGSDDANREGVAGRIGRHRAPDGSQGAPVEIDFERPHAGLVVGKRGSGKSHTLAVLAEELAAADGVTPVVVDPMGAFDGLAAAGARVVREPRVAPGALAPRTWCALLDVEPTSTVGALLWRATEGRDSLAAIEAAVAESTASEATRRAATNLLGLAARWDVFAADGVSATDLRDGRPTVLDCSGLPTRAANAVCRALVDDLYRRAVEGAAGPLPWVLIDEAHAFFDGVAAPAIERVLTRGRQPGISVVLATQRPDALPEVAVSQSDLLVAHRLTARRDVDALAALHAAYQAVPLADRLPGERGAALVVDDASESVRAVAIRARETPDSGASPRASVRT